MKVYPVKGEVLARQVNMPMYSKFEGSKLFGSTYACGVIEKSNSINFEPGEVIIFEERIATRFRDRDENKRIETYFLVEGDYVTATLREE